MAIWAKVLPGIPQPGKRLPIVRGEGLDLVTLIPQQGLQPR
jgi:hypothetical protein